MATATTPTEDGSVILISMSSAAEVSQATEEFLANVLTSTAISDLHILSPSSYALKTLKMDAYSIAGQQGRNLSVSTHELVSDNGSSAARILEENIAEITKQHSIQGVLIGLPTGESIQSHPSMALLPHAGADGPMTGAISFLDSDGALLKTAFQCTVSLLHSTARATLPHLRRRTQATTVIGSGRNALVVDTKSLIHSSRLHSGPFFALVNPPISPLAPGQSDFHAKLCDLALSEVAVAAGDLVQVGYADEILPKPVVQNGGEGQLRVDEKMNGGGPGVPRLSIPAFSPSRIEDEDSSPTKLWSAWAMQEDA